MLLLLAEEMLVLFWFSVNSAAVVPFSAAGFRVGGMFVILCGGRAWLFSDSEMCKIFKLQNIGRVMLNFPLVHRSKIGDLLRFIKQYFLHVNTDGFF